MKSVLIFTPIYCIAIYLIFAFFNYDWMWMRFIPTSGMVRLCLLLAIVPLGLVIGNLIDSEQQKQSWIKYKKDHNWKD